MKTAKDPRHLNRIKVMQQVFAWDFNREDEPQDPIASEIVTNVEKIDEYIKTAAPAWPIEKINKIDLSILRQAIYELVIKPEQPSKVIIDEAVELAKEYGSDSSPAFINGALGKLIADKNISIP